MDKSSLSHTKWNCIYHIVFIPKYRRRTMYGKLRKDIREIIKKLCEYKGVKIVEGIVSVDMFIYVSRSLRKLVYQPLWVF